MPRPDDPPVWLMWLLCAVVAVLLTIWLLSVAVPVSGSGPVAPIPTDTPTATPYPVPRITPESQGGGVQTCIQHQLDDGRVLQICN